MRHHFKNLKVWQVGMEIVILVYKLTSKFPKEEKFSLVSQINRSAVSVPSNIAEGSGRGTDKDFGHFLEIALGSLYELETQLILSNNLEFIEGDDFENIGGKVSELERMIIGLIKSLKSKI